MRNQIIFAAIAAALCLPASGLAWEASIVPPTRKIVPTAEIDYPTYPSAAVEGCRNEWEMFQVVIRVSEPVTGVNASISELSDGNGHIVPASAARFYREWFLDVVNPSGWGIEVENHTRRPGLYPDPLIPFNDPYSDEGGPVGAPFDIDHPSPGLAVVMVDILIPASAVPGVYEGTVTVTATDRSDITIPVSLTVWEIDMPSEKNVGTAFRMSDSQVRRYHGGPSADETSPEFDRILKNYYEAGHEHRIDPTGFKGPVDFQFDGDGNLIEVDWTAYDAYMAPYLEGTYFNDGIGVARFDVGMFGPGRGRSLTDDQYKKAAAELARHLDEKGWWRKAWVYSKDEPWLSMPGDDPAEAEADMAAVANDSKLLVEASDLWKGKILVTGPMFDQAAQWVGIWCPVQPMFDSWYWTEQDYPGRGDYDAHLAGGGELWFYNCNGNLPPYPGYDIDTTIGYEPRILKWGSWYEGATGYLYWRQLYWGDFDPWVEWQDIPGFGAPFARNGDGLLIYPGDGDGTFADARTPEFLSLDGPIVSFRMKQIRDGFEDWEMFIMAEKAGMKDWVRNEIGKVYRRFGNFMEQNCDKQNYYCPDDEPWTLDETALLEIRSRIAAKLLFTMYPDRYPDPDEPLVTEPTEETQPPETAEIPDTSEDTAGDDVILDTSTDNTTADVTADDDGQQPDNAGRGGSGCSLSGGKRNMTPFAALLLAAVAAMTILRRKMCNIPVDNRN